MIPKKAQNYLACVLLTVLTLFLCLPGTQKLPMVDRDSAHFAVASRQMLENQQFFKIQFQDQARNLKPPGIYWLQAAAVKLFDSPPYQQICAYRMPSILGAILSVLLTFYFARRFYPLKIAFIAGLSLAMSLFLTFETRLIITDTMQLAAIVAMQGALWCIYVAARENRQINSSLVWIFWIAMAFGILFKGIAPLIAILTLIGLVLVDRKLSWLRALKPLQGIAIVFLFTLAWILPLSMVSHSNFLFDMIKQDLLPKIIHGQQSHGMPPGYYALTLPITLWPISCLFWFGACYAITERKNPVVRFLLIWFVSNWLCFEIIHTKLPEYLLPVYPAIAIAMAASLFLLDFEKLSKPWRAWLVIYGFCWVLYSVGLAFAFVFLPHFLSQQISWLAIFLALVITLLAIFVYICLLKRRWAYLLTTTYLLALIMNIALFAWLLPAQNALWISNQVADALPKQALSEQHPLYAIAYQEPSLVFLLGTHKVQFTPFDDLQSHKGQVSWLLVDAQQALQLQKQGWHLEKVKQIKGYNYSIGRWQSLILNKVIADDKIL